MQLTANYYCFEAENTERGSFYHDSIGMEIHEYPLLLEGRKGDLLMNPSIGQEKTHVKVSD